MGDETWGGVGSRWGACAEDLSALLLFSSEFGAPVSVPVQEILDVICRTLSISAKNIVSAAGAQFAAWPRPWPWAAGGQRGRQAPAALSPLRLPRPAPSLRPDASAPCACPDTRAHRAGSLPVFGMRPAEASSGEGEPGLCWVPAERFSHAPCHPLSRVWFRGRHRSGWASWAWGPFLPVYRCLWVRVSPCFPFLPRPHSCRVSHRACLETVPCGCCFCLPSTWMPWTCSPRSSSREWEGAGCSEGTRMCWDGRSPFCPHPQVWRPSLALWGPHQPPASPGPQCLELW